MTPAFDCAAEAWGQWPLIGLFLSAFWAATILPVSSELVLGALVAGGCAGLWPLIALATAGNVAGALVNWGLGRFFAGFRERPWFPLSAAQFARGSAWFQRYGVWSLLLAWLPLVGDPLTLVAGLLKVRFWPFLLLVTLGKGARYIVLAQTVSAVSG